jgi:enterochelin esterase-like enzyme
MLRSHLSSKTLCLTATLPLILAGGAASFLLGQQAPTTPVAKVAPPAKTAAPKDGKHGTFEKIKVHGKSLEGNLEGDTPDRDVLIYLPPSYKTSPGRRYPVVYFLHGYGIGAEQYWNNMKVDEAADKTMGEGLVHEMILVHPDANTIYNGSMYSNSPTTGNWETYLTHDLISYVDSHYRTIATPASRGLVGHSMGGYGTLRIAMKYPGLFSSIYAMSSCCLMNNPGAGGGGNAKGKAAPPPAPKADAAKGDAAKGKGKGGGGGFANVNLAEGAAWSPNPMNPPQYLDLPTVNGVVNPAIAAKWVANSPLAMIDQYVVSLKTYKAIRLDVGMQDTLANSNKEMNESMNRLGITHVFDPYEGDHTNRIKERFETRVLPFFSENLTFPAAAAKAKAK